MGTLALVNPSSGFTAVKKKFGNQLVNQDNILKILLPLENAGDPTNAVTPDFIGQLCADTTGNKLYYASTLASSGWLVLN